LSQRSEGRRQKAEGKKNKGFGFNSIKTELIISPVND
jgi:hypothetical protein